MRILLLLAILLAHQASAAYRVERYAEPAGALTCPIVFRHESPARNSWRPIITPGWPLSGGRWTIKWEGTF